MPSKAMTLANTSGSSMPIGKSAFPSSSWFAGLCAGFGVGVAGRPVFWREGHVPEQGIGQEELHSYLGLVGLTPINVRDNALERGFGLDVRQREPLPSINLRQQENQRTVSTDGPCVSFFFKGSSAGLTRDTDWDGHQYALAPATVCREPGGFAGLG